MNKWFVVVIILCFIIGRIINWIVKTSDNPVLCILYFSKDSRLKMSGISQNHNARKTQNFLLLLTLLTFNLNFVKPLTAQETGACGPVDYYHLKIIDLDKHLDSWHKDSDGPFVHILDLSASWWKNAPDVDGWPVWCTAAVVDKNYSQENGATPGSTCSFAITSCLKYYIFTGDSAYLKMAVRTGRYIIQRDLTSSNRKKYPNFPYAVGATGDSHPDGSGHPDLDYSMNIAGSIEPDKGAMLGCSLLKLYEVTGDEKFLKVAINIANCLSENAIKGTSSNSPWPMRVMANKNTTIDGRFSTNVSYACRLFDELLRIGQKGNGQYLTTRNAVWSWLKTYVISYKNASKWMCFFEDHDGDEFNPNQTNALETVRYLLEKKEMADSNWFDLSGKIITQVLDRWAITTLKDDGYVSIVEQENDQSPYNSHTARLGSILAMYFEAGAASFNKDVAYHSLCYGMYSVENDGFTNTYYSSEGYGKAWTSDSFGDFIGHYIDAFAAVPEWAGNGNHLLRSSGAIKKILYEGENWVTYTAYDTSGTDKIKLLKAPVSVSVNDHLISSYSWDNKTNVLMINRTTGSVVEINLGSPYMPIKP